MRLTTRRGERHEYLDLEDDAKYFSVTQVRKVAKDVYQGIPEDVLEQARRRGQILHTYFWRYLGARDGHCEALPVIHGYEGYCQAIIKWADSNNVLPIRLEEASCNEELGYAGCPDALALYGPRSMVKLVDLKTGEPQVTDPMQLIAYKKMRGYGMAKEMLDLYVRQDGTYKEVTVTQAQQVRDWPAFTNALNLLKWRNSGY